MPSDRELSCTSTSVGQVDCDLGEPVPTTVQWYVDDIYVPSLDNQTSVQITGLICRRTFGVGILAVISGGHGNEAIVYGYFC
jgi:hypothetical protein